MLEAPKQFSVLGLPVHLAVDYTNWLRDRLHSGVSTHIVTLNAEMVIQAEQNEQLAAAIRQADLVIPDGAGVILYLRRRGYRQRRCPGIELAESLLEQLGKRGESYPIFFYGGAPGVASSAADYWKSRSPELSITTSHGYLNSDGQTQLQQTLKQQQPRLIFVGLGVPRQELWIAANRQLCPQATWIGVGGSFDIWAGIKNRAPEWLREHNLEWLYRLYQEPWRWRRMLALPQFAWRALVVRC
ncbi:MAG: WecB/TagA/CpsF family glycosyltransferase [Oscillatoria sp. PMC 1051.18]|nr:WecB/TagA/CpsF family glycosyltransferase [Oscillatoria sp. PMC 1050.18]MEC5030843.1 WecB/TagA/CpsF family glycosyltransferase [Oscillatoria sp. PMC 1051.18]